MGISCSYLGGKRLYYAQLSKTWPKVEGTLLSSSFERSKGNQVWLSLQYQYNIGERRYIGNNYLSGDNNLINLGEARVFQSKYRSGDKLSIYYNTRSPNESCVVNGRISIEDVGFACMGVIGLIIGAYLFRKV